MVKRAELERTESTDGMRCQNTRTEMLADVNESGVNGELEEARVQGKRKEGSG